MRKIRKEWLLGLVVVLLLSILPAVAYPGYAGAVADVSEPDVIVAAGAPGVSNTYMPDMELLSDGRLVVVYYSAIAHEATNGHIMMTESLDYGQTWSTPVVAINTAEDDRDPSITELSDGTLVISFFTFNNTTAARHARVARSTDGGATWGAPITVGTNLASTSAVTSKVVELTNGDLLIPIYGQINSRQEMPRSTAVRSTDGGLTWSAATEVTLAGPASGPNIGFVEPVIVDLGGGHLYSVHRTLSNNDDYHSWESHSYDNGYTWTLAERTSLKAHCSDLLLLSNGMLLHLWGDRSFTFAGGRPVVGKAVPVGEPMDDYQNILLYRNAGVGDMAYPSAVELPDGSIFFVFYDASRMFIGGSYATVGELSKLDPKDRLDLLGLYNDGFAQISTDMVWTTPSHPETGVTGAIDGNLSYWNASFRGSKAPPAAYYELEFAEPVALRAVGISIRPTFVVDATVAYSSDGTSWQTLRSYSDFNQPLGELDMIEPVGGEVLAKKVRVEVASSSQWAGLTELALFGKLPAIGEKIDLLAMYDNDASVIDTNMTATISAQPGIGIRGAIDGIPTYWNAATRNTTVGPPAYYQVDLGSVRSISGIGITLKPGYAQDAAVQVSTDGVTWLQAVAYTDAVHVGGVLDMNSFSSPLLARFVKVVIMKSQGWPLLAELELYERQ